MIIDANAHASRLAVVEGLLKTNDLERRYLLIKVLLDTTEATLRHRIQERPPRPNCYQGTEGDLSGSFIASKIHREDYDLVVDTEAFDQEMVANKVHRLIQERMAVPYS